MKSNDDGSNSGELDPHGHIVAVCVRRLEDHRSRQTEPVTCATIILRVVAVASTHLSTVRRAGWKRRRGSGDSYEHPTPAHLQAKLPTVDFS